MKNFFTTKRLCRAGIIAALYVALTYAFGAIAYQGVLQIRPAEALTILPLFFPEAAPALWIGCMLANLASPFIAFDVPLGGLFPVLVNAFVIPVVIVFLCGGDEGYASANIAYWSYFGSLCATEALWVYGLGIPLYIAIYGLRKKGVTAFCDASKKPPESEG